MVYNANASQMTADVPFQSNPLSLMEKTALSVFRPPSGQMEKFLFISVDASIRAKKTCVRFRYRNDNDEDYVIILRDPKGTCNSVVGRKGGFQELRLGDECLNARKTILHELMHAIGFIHEHTRYDRDNYVSINFNNIKPERKSNFEKYKASEVTFLGTEYAYESIMHYTGTEFARNRRIPTIIPKTRKNVKLGGDDHHLSDIDVTRINRYYGCNTQPKPSAPKGHTFSIIWLRLNDGITMSADCDFYEHNLKNVLSKGKDCGPLCARDSECDHFAWSNYNGGTCWMKKGYNPKNVIRAEGIVCGFIHSKL